MGGRSMTRATALLAIVLGAAAAGCARPSCDSVALVRTRHLVESDRVVLEGFTCDGRCVATAIANDAAAAWGATSGPAWWSPGASAFPERWRWAPGWMIER